MKRLIRMITDRLTFAQYRAEVLRDASVTQSTAAVASSRVVYESDLISGTGVS
jgi:hypothetical protein